MAPIIQENVVVVYRQADSESESAAFRYMSMHGLSSDQLIKIPCSSIEILDSYSDFKTEVEDPIIDALTESSSPLVNRTVYAIVLMPKVPGGFRDEDDIISSTSRISRIFSAFNSGEKYIQNPLYDRKLFKRFDEEDAEFALICTRIDSPLSSITNIWMDNIQTANSQLLVNGAFYFDAYSSYQGDEAHQYETDLLEFRNDLLERLGLGIVDSTRVDPYRDALISAVENDSFFWGWGADRGSLSYFRNSSNIRGFFYNADFDGAETVRNIDDRTWPVLAIRRGYIATAGSMSDPGIDSFLRPEPFYQTLFRGGTMGEAMLFSQPKLNTPIACFGDPLSRFSFPLLFDSEELIEEETAWEEINKCFAKSCINIFRKNKILKEIRDMVVLGNNVNVALDFLKPINRLCKLFEEPDWKNDYVNLAIAMFNLAVIRNQTSYLSFYPQINDYLAQTQTVIPEITLDALMNEEAKILVEDSLLYQEGTWELTFELEHTPGTFSFYHFQMDVATDSDFDNIIMSRDSFISARNWLFEKEPNKFFPINLNGVTSNYAGMRIRYECQEEEVLDRGRYYYFRVLQKDQLTVFGYRNFREVIYR